MNPHFYTRGDKIPGIRADGNNVFEVREVIKFGKNYALEHGPLFIELMTYRYSGHSMSDPGTTYRTRDEVQTRRKTTDPIHHLMEIAEQYNLATLDELQVFLSPCRKLTTRQLSLSTSRLILPSRTQMSAWMRSPPMYMSTTTIVNIFLCRLHQGKALRGVSHPKFSEVLIANILTKSLFYILFIYNKVLKKLNRKL